MAQRGRGAAAGARPAARTGAQRSGGATSHGAAPDLAATRARLRAIIEPAVQAADLDLRGRLVKVRAGEANLTARVVAVDEAGVVLEADGRSQTVAFGELGPGRVQVEFRHLDEVDSASLRAEQNNGGEEFDDSGDGPTEQE